jgi:hypothetical protein
VGDVALFEQRLQDDQQVQVEATERHSVTPCQYQAVIILWK